MSEEGDWGQAMGTRTGDKPWVWTCAPVCSDLLMTRPGLSIREKKNLFRVVAQETGPDADLSSPRTDAWHRRSAFVVEDENAPAGCTAT